MLILVLVIVSEAMKLVLARLKLVKTLLVMLQAILISSKPNADIRPNYAGPLSHLDGGADDPTGRRLPHNINI